MEVWNMIKLLGISGSRVKNGNMEALLKEAFWHVQQNQELQTELIYLAGKEINPCNHCNWCIKSQTEDKYCTQDDDMSAIYPKLLEADGIIVASPSHFGRLSGSMADLIDRSRAFIHGKVYKLPLKNKIGGAMALAFFRGGGIETTLSSLNLFFFVHQMIVANSDHTVLRQSAGQAVIRFANHHIESNIQLAPFGHRSEQVYGLE